MELISLIFISLVLLPVGFLLLGELPAYLGRKAGLIVVN